MCASGGWSVCAQLSLRTRFCAHPPCDLVPSIFVPRLEAGTNMAATMDGFKTELQEMRKMVELEERCADPATLDAVKRAYRQKVGMAALS